MAKTKKKTKAVSRKKTKVTKKIDTGLLEYEGWKIGDTAFWCTSTEATPRQGTVVRFHPEDSIAPAVSLNDTTHGGQRVTLVKFIFETKKEAKDARPEFLEFWQNYRNKK
jgi:hypothetical protein|tara:strand:- start:902 stop:1231 length:330 start_codon:yes stop_codon:yes gene_type:complete